MIVIMYDDKDHVDGRNMQPHLGFNFPNMTLADLQRDGVAHSFINAAAALEPRIADKLAPKLLCLIR